MPERVSLIFRVSVYSSVMSESFPILLSCGIKKRAGRVSSRVTPFLRMETEDFKSSSVGVEVRNKTINAFMQFLSEIDVVLGNTCRCRVAAVIVSMCLSIQCCIRSDLK